MREVETIVIGAGIAGLSLAARIAPHGSTLVIEAESAPGYHASGRSVAIAHFGLGEQVVRTLTALSLPALAADPLDDRARSAGTHPALHIARADELAALDALEEVHRQFGCDYERIDGEEARALFPALRSGENDCNAAIVDHGALKLDADAMLQGHLRDLRAAGGEMITNAPAQAISRKNGLWVVETPRGSFAAPILVNAAGAWVDQVARIAGVTQIGIEPRRRTVITFAGPTGTDVSSWPFTKTVGEGFYILPEGTGRLLASPQDEGKSAPCDAAPEEFDIATIAHKIEEACSLTVERIEHSWAGLRSFAPDELPVVGYADAAPGFFWFAGQGGYGFQTSPVLARIGEALMFGLEWPEELREAGIDPAIFNPARFGA